MNLALRSLSLYTRRLFNEVIGGTMQTYYRRNLPHFQPPGTTFFVTCRLAGSLPAEVQDRLRQDREIELGRILSMGNPARRSARYTEYQEESFSRFELLLDTMGTGPLWLRNPVVGRIISDAIHRIFSPPHELICFCLMPNHLHLLCSPASPDSVEGCKKFPLTDHLRLFKGSTARLANQALGRQGPFWQHESYDHAVRDGLELERFFWYILMNPVKAGLVSSFEDWPWTYWHRDYMDLLAR